jgi:uncharacterized protein YdbL (DUF1318 family)
MHKKLNMMIVVFLTSFLLAGSLHADSAGEAAGRIIQRLAQIDAMKSSGEVGEDAKGYLAERKPLEGRKASIVTSENADRKLIYAEVASRTGQSEIEVGAQRALQIAERALSGVWLQKSSGEWYQKP